jgi:hypothetical protein
MGTCRLCGNPLTQVVDLGEQPHASWFPAQADLTKPDPSWPLRVYVCQRCWLLQLDDTAPAEPALPGQPSFMSSGTMRAHGDAFVARLVADLGLQPEHRIVELASHSGYLQPFFDARGLSTLILEADSAIAGEAQDRGLHVAEMSLDGETGAALCAEGGPADLIVDNYLAAHVRDLNGLMAGMAALLAPDGALVIEFAHLLPMVTGLQFDSIRHGHFSYLSLTAVRTALANHDLVVYDAAEFPVYGGVLRVLARRRPSRNTGPSRRVEQILAAERAAGLGDPNTYVEFRRGVDRIRADLVGLLSRLRTADERVVAYGAPSRGNTLINSCGITVDIVEFTVDRSTAKQGRFLPGSHLPILAPEALARAHPSVVLILTWDIQEEVIRQLADIRQWGGRFLVPIPQPVLF